ncbi:hypothetical protein [Mycolicibacterium sp. XJ870]
MSGRGGRKIKPTAFRDRNDDEPFNASGVVQVDARRFVFVDNNVSTAVFELEFDAGVDEVRDIRRRRLMGVTEAQLGDPEGFARIDANGEIYLVATSSLAVTGKRNIRDGLVRIHYTPGGDLPAEPMPGFRDWLLGQDLLRAEHYEQKPDAGGLNIEGLTWDPAAGVLVFGLRGPAVTDCIRLIEVPVDAGGAPWSTASLGPPSILHVGIPSSAGLQGVRDISYDEDTGDFILLLGRALSDGDEPFLLAVWNRDRNDLHILDTKFHKSMKPEGITTFFVGGQKKMLIVDDRGGYAVIDH